MPAWSQVTLAWRQGQCHLVCPLAVTWRQEGKVSPGLRAEVRGSSRRNSILDWRRKCTEKGPAGLSQVLWDDPKKCSLNLDLVHKAVGGHYGLPSYAN